MNELLTFNVYIRILIEVGIHISLVLNCFKHTHRREQGMNICVCVYNWKQNDVKQREGKKEKASIPLHVFLSTAMWWWWWSEMIFIRLSNQRRQTNLILFVWTNRRFICFFLSFGDCYIIDCSSLLTWLMFIIVAKYDSNRTWRQQQRNDEDKKQHCSFSDLLSLITWRKKPSSQVGWWFISSRSLEYSE